MIADGVKLLIDEIDSDLIRDHNWSVVGKGYLKCSTGEYRDKYLHCVIAERMGLSVSGQIDHRDLNRLNNQRDNLRTATQSQNQANQRMRTKNTSGYKGVTRQANKWRAQIGLNGERKYLGLFDTPKEAHEAYCAAADQHFGEFANHG